MLSLLAMSFGEYLEFYQKFLIKEWNHMTPAKFTIMLSVVAAVGFLMMRSSTKRI